jgi:pilus assembly protein CpaF
MLVVAGRAHLTARLIDSLAAAVPTSHSVTWLADNANIAPEGKPSVVLDGKDDSRAIRGVSRLSPDHVFVPTPHSDWIGPIVDAINEGTAGVVLGATASTLRQALSRMGTTLAMRSPGVEPQTAHQWIGAAFDLGIEVTRLRDGRLKVARISEIRADAHGLRLHDIFTFAYHRTAAGGSIEGSFYATGTVPRVVEDLAAHGNPLDTSMFRRHPSG